MADGMPLDWLSAAEIADRALPGMPTTKQNVLKLADAEGWYGRRAGDGTPLIRATKGRGGERKEFHVSLLPAEAREALEMRALAANDTDEPARRDWDWLKRQPAKVRGVVNSRLAALATVTAHEEAGLVRSVAVNRAASAHGVSAGSVWNWLAAVKDLPDEEWGPALAPNYKGGKRAADIDSDAWAYLKSIYLHLGKQPWDVCYREMVDKYAKPRGLWVPSSITLKRKLEREVPPEVIQLKRYGKEAADNMQPTQRRSVAEYPAMYGVNIDGHTFDVFVNFGDDVNPVIARPVLVGLADVRTRKLLAWRIGRTENTALVRLTLLDLFSEWGVPEKCTLDNGRAFSSRAISGGSKTRNRFKFNEGETEGILVGLGVDCHWTRPYSGRSKPIERTWGDLCNTISKHWKLDGAYTGGAPHKKPENYGKRAIPLAEFTRFVNDRIAEHNARPGRRTEVCKGKLSFDEAFTASIETATVRRASREQLRLAFLEQKTLTLDPNTAEIRNLFGNRYWSSDLARWAGKKVIVRYDPERLAQPVDVFSADRDAFICSAPLWEDARFYSKEDAEKTARRQQQHRKRVRALVEEQALLERDELDRIFDGASPTPPTAKPTPARTGIVQSRRTKARALKHAASAAAKPVDDDFDDDFVAGLAARRGLRVVG